MSKLRLQACVYFKKKYYIYIYMYEIICLCIHMNYLWFIYELYMNYIWIVYIYIWIIYQASVYCLGVTNPPGISQSDVVEWDKNCWRHKKQLGLHCSSAPWCAEDGFMAMCAALVDELLEGIFLDNSYHKPPGIAQPWSWSNFRYCNTSPA